MRKLTHYQRGTWQIRSFYFWGGIPYPLGAVRDRYSIRHIKPR